jgi:glutaredoxin 3
MEDAVGLGEADGAKHDCLGRERARRHAASLVTLSGESFAASGTFSLVLMRIQVYTTAWCGYCERAKALLEGRDIPYEEIRVDGDPAFRARLLDLTGRWTVPQIVIDGKPVGGYVELRELDRRGFLDELAA